MSPRRPQPHRLYECTSTHCRKTYKRANDRDRHVERKKQRPDENHPTLYEPPGHDQIHAALATRKRTRILAQKKEYDARSLPQIRRLAKTLPESHPCRDFISRIVDYLLENKIRRDSNYRTVPIPDDALYRLHLDASRTTRSQKDVKVLDAATGDKNKWPINQLLAALYQLQANPGTKTSGSVVHLASLWSIPITHENGLKRWSETVHQNLLAEDPDIELGPFTVTWSPVQTMSDWHLDCTSTGTILIEIDGPKLMLKCPPTDKNLKVFSEMVKDRVDKKKPWEQDFTRFEKLSYIVLIKGDRHEMPPGTLHMVVSLRNAAVGGFECTRREWAGDIDRLQRWDEEDRKRMREECMAK
jgi:hypothetical protein